MYLDIPTIKQKFNHPLPGAPSQNKMSPVKDNSKYRVVPDDHKVAAVLCLFHEKEDGLHITYIERASSHPGDKHAGQIGFPGGKMEAEDVSFADCALRETEEELGIQADKIELLGSLTPLYVFASNFQVYPFVGYVDFVPEYIPQESEVSSVVEVPVSHLLHPDTKTNRSLQLADGAMFDVPGYKLGSHFLWGATAMVTSEVEDLLGVVV